jgi:glycolate oxidase
MDNSRQPVSGPDPRLLRRLGQIVGEKALLIEPEQLRTYECDGLTNFRVVPAAVVIPSTASQVQEIVRLCHAEGVPFVARGSGTGLSGGALPAHGGIVISLTRLNRILEVDLANSRVVVEPGVINAHVTQRVTPYGYFYAPDPSSQSVCTIGGNVAENSGGAHCLKYGFTTTHVLALEVVMPDGSLAHFGTGTLDSPGYDLCGVFVGSEGTLGIATKITLRIVRRPQVVQTMIAAFDSTDATGEAVSRIIAVGIVPAAAEMMDRLALEAAEAAVHAGYPACEGLLLVEVDGSGEEVAILIDRIRQICKDCGAWEMRLAQSEAERAALWKGRKAAFASMGRISPDYIVQDGVIPRTALPQVLRQIREMGDAAGLRVANVFHAGDGNLHPLVLYDRRIEGQEARAEKLSGDILRLCIKAGGSITGEHGVGMEKRDYMAEMFAEPDLQTMQRVRLAFDPKSLCNPEKIFPRPRLCAERQGRYEPHPLEQAGVAEFF